MLDESHTRGELKRHVSRELDRFVSPAGAVREALRAWIDAGKRLFVVTNSDRAFATTVLDAIIGPSWPELFAVVVVNAGKPGFFSHEDAGETVSGARDHGLVLERSSARAVEARLGVSGDRVLYAGDNARSDVAPARAHGWRTVHVVAELAGGGDAAPWGHALDHEGAPTWFAGVIRAHADLVCDRIDRFLAADPRGRFDESGDWFDRVGRVEAP
jgi:FMN phosphatase YigB (HAD superfamily)